MLVNYIEGKRAFNEEMKLKYGEIGLGKGYNRRADNPHVKKDPSLIPSFGWTIPSNALAP